ncbi:MAG: hypothetical protein ACKOEM_20730, partial [Planctomycetia bacterium]
MAPPLPAEQLLFAPGVSLCGGGGVRRTEAGPPDPGAWLPDVRLPGESSMQRSLSVALVVGVVGLSAG